MLTFAGLRVEIIIIKIVVIIVFFFALVDKDKVDLFVGFFVCLSVYCCCCCCCFVLRFFN